MPELREPALVVRDDLPLHLRADERVESRPDTCELH